MKKILPLILATALIFTLFTGCGRTKTPNEDIPDDFIEENIQEGNDIDDDIENSTPDTDDKNKEDPEKPITQTPKPNPTNPTNPKPTNPKPTTPPSDDSDNKTEENKPSEPEPQKSLNDIMTFILKGVDAPMSAMVQVNQDTFKSSLFIDYIAGSQALSADAMIASIPHSVVLLRVPDGVNAASVASQIRANADPRKWICVGAEKVVVELKGNVILLVMSQASTADAIANNFKAS